MSHDENNDPVEQPGRAAERKAALRKQAEAQARRMESSAQSALPPPEAVRKTLHELRVHQIELEMQNEELRTARADIEAGWARYFDLYDMAPVAYCSLSEQGLILEVNLTAAMLLGVTRSAMVKQPITRFIFKDDQDVYYLHSKKLFKTGEAQECELRLVKPDGAAFWAHLMGTVSKADDGAPVCRVVISDISDRKQADIYREMWRDILLILSEPGDNLHECVRRVLTELKTRTAFDAVGLRLQSHEDFPYFDQDGFPESFLLTENTVVERGKDGNLCRDKDGKVCLECTCGLVLSGKTDPENPLFTKGGSSWTNDSFPFLDLPSDQDPRRHPRNNCIHYGYASVALIPIRITDRIVGLIQLNDKRKDCFTPEIISIMEGIAAHIGSALMRKHAETERGKLQAQLAQAQKMESVGRLAGGVAHDFNNMLMGIIGYANMCREEIGENRMVCEWVDEIIKGAERSAKLTRQLLAFARKQTIAPKVLDLNDTVTDILTLLRRLIGEGIELSWQPGAALWAVKLDPGQIDQMLTNLCVNARDAIGGVGKIAIETRNVSIDTDDCTEHAEALIGDHVLLAISDNGCGMDSETLAQVFEPFFTTKGVGEGMGLGLATVYGIVKQNNGFVTADSEPGKGTTIRIYLPRYGDEQRAREAAAAKAERPGGSETVMLVEDEKIVLTVTARFLEKLGYNVLTAETPAAALRLAAEHEGAIALLITDVVMPGMNGCDLAAELCRQYPHLKCLFISGYTADIIAPQGILEDGVHFLPKPFSRDEIARKVRDILDGHSPT